MPYNKPIRLKVAGKRDFVFPLSLLTLLAVLAALLSTQPVLLTIVTVLIFATGWGIFTLDFPKVSGSDLISVISADGSVGLEFANRDKIEGIMGGQQWCTHHVAVLHVIHGDSTRRLVILSAQQRNADDFRRLNMWIRQDFCHGIRENRESGIWPFDGFRNDVSR